MELWQAFHQRVIDRKMQHMIMLYKWQGWMLFKKQCASLALIWPGHRSHLQIKNILFSCRCIIMIGDIMILLLLCTSQTARKNKNNNYKMMQKSKLSKLQTIIVHVWSHRWSKCTNLTSWGHDDPFKSVISNLIKLICGQQGLSSI